jgi:hypothetical protein
MKAKHLAEAIIMQSIEDLWNEDHRAECIDFFTGQDFRTCASIAGIDTAGQIQILNLVGESIKGFTKPAKTGKRAAYKYLPRPQMRDSQLTGR